MLAELGVTGADGMSAVGRGECEAPSPGGRTVVYTAAKVPAGVSETLGCELLTTPRTSVVQLLPDNNVVSGVYYYYYYCIIIIYADGRNDKNEKIKNYTAEKIPPPFVPRRTYNNIFITCISKSGGGDGGALVFGREIPYLSSYSPRRRRRCVFFFLRFFLPLVGPWQNAPLPRLQ